MARNLHTYHSFPLKFRQIVVLGGFDHKKQFLEKSLHIQITVEHFVIDTLQTKKVSITGAVLTLEN